MKQQLDEKGKVILYTHFDTDKTTLQPNGEKVIAEIAGTLQQEPGLKLSMNGYTGTAAHNKQLSINQVQTVRTSLVEHGINGANLQAVVWGG